MIERTVERSKDGGIEKILERTLSPLEEVVALCWPKVKHALRQRDAVDLEAVELTINNVAPTPHEMRLIVNMLCDKIVAEADAFQGTKWKEIHWVFPGLRQS